MERVQNIEHFDGLIAAQKKRTGAQNLNCFLLAPEIEKAARADRLLYEENDAGAVFFLDKGRFYNAYLFINIQIPSVVQGKEKPLVVELLGNHALSPKLQKAETWLLDAGFLRNSSSRRMQYRNFDVSEKAFALEDTFGFDIRQAESSDAPGILQLWESSMEPLANLLPDLEGLQTSIACGHVFCAVSRDTGELLGAEQIEHAQTQGSLWHVVVNPAARGKKIGFALIMYFLGRLHRMSTQEAMLWVEEAAGVATALYLRIGFKFDGRISVQYIKR